MMKSAYQKECDCERATASGPRLVPGEPEETDDSVNIPMRWVPMACDECDTPWTRPRTEPA